MLCLLGVGRAGPDFWEEQDVYIWEEGRDRQLETPAWVFEGVLREHGMEYLSCLMEF